ELIHRAVVARLVPQLSSGADRPIDEQEHEARLLLALHAEGFVEDGAHVALAADILVRLLREAPAEGAERFRLTQLGPRCCEPLSETGLRLRTEAVRALTRLERVPEAQELIEPLRRDLADTLGASSRAAIELDADAVWILRDIDPIAATELATATYERAIE